MVWNVHFSNITVRNVGSAEFLAGCLEQRFENVTFWNVEIDATPSVNATDMPPAVTDNYDWRNGFV
ncbi:hypothetical protein [Halomontanus rarus]|uniref:hypothetical protein n=1 Tax=Halomontanus rarus TaxID=3034020 RepID=UPI001A99F433